jgi:hypothetical protein
MASPAAPTTLSRFVWIAMFGAVLFGAGLLVGTATKVVVPGRELDDGNSSIERIEQAVGDLRRELTHLREYAPNPSSLLLPPSSERVAASGESSTAAAIERIEKTLLELSPRRTSDRRDLVPSALGHASLMDVQRDFERRGGPEADRDELRRDMTKAHLLWTIDHLIERYGTPRRVDWTSGKLELVYGFDGGESPYPKPYARFVIRDGLVVLADVEPD